MLDAKIVSSYITIRVVGQDGRPKRGVKVSIGKDSLVGGVSGVVYTNSEGEAEFKWDSGSPIVVYVNGSAALRNQAVRSNIKVTI